MKKVTKEQLDEIYYYAKMTTTLIEELSKNSESEGKKKMKLVIQYDQDGTLYVYRDTSGRPDIDYALNGSSKLEHIPSESLDDNCIVDTGSYLVFDILDE